MEKKRKWNRLNREDAVFLLFFLAMAVYYGWRLFTLTPWYDELYTYYYFISRGPVYAAIHWPLPNNHVGYSVLSGCLMIFGNPAIALRGVSYLSSLAALYLLYQTGKKLLGKELALMPVFLFAGMSLVNQLAVQGRGYALVTFCYLLAIWELIRIVVEQKNRKWDTLLFGLSLVLALWAIPSSVYVVIPVCVTGGLYLLLQKEYRRLGRLILISLISALCTVGLYGILWLAVGSNLLMKTEGSAYCGQGHVAIILHAPVQAALTGIEYMLATPYIQSVAREGYLHNLANWIKNLLNYYYTGAAVFLAVILVVGGITALVCVGKKTIRKQYRAGAESRYEDFTEIYLVCSVVLLPLMLIIQGALPYYRVFSFAGVVVAIMITWLWQKGRKFRKVGNYWAMAGCVFSALAALLLLSSPAYRTPYSERETAIEDALRQTKIETADKIGVTDCDQEYLLKYLYDIPQERMTRQVEEADVVVADRYLLGIGNGLPEDENPDDWKLYLSQEQFGEALEAGTMVPVYENERFVVYERKTKAN